MRIQRQSNVESITMKFTIALSAVLLAAPALAQEARLPPIPPERYDEAQKKAAAEFEAVSKRPPYGPFTRLMYSPDLIMPIRVMGGYVRRGSAIGPALGELAILVTTREWSQDYAWKQHATSVREDKLIKPEIVDAIADGRRPTNMSPDEEIIYDFSTELHHNKSVSDATYARAKDRFGDKGVVDLTVVNGYYTMVSMVLNMAHAKALDGSKLSRFPD